MAGGMLVRCERTGELRSTRAGVIAERAVWRVATRRPASACMVAQQGALVLLNATDSLVRGRRAENDAETAVYH